MVCVRCGEEVVDAHAFRGWCGQRLTAKALLKQPDGRTGSTNREVTYPASKESDADVPNPAADAAFTRSQPRSKEILRVLTVAMFSLIALAVILPNKRPIQIGSAGASEGVQERGTSELT